MLTVGGWKRTKSTIWQSVTCSTFQQQQKIRMIAAIPQWKITVFAREKEWQSGEEVKGESEPISISQN